MGDTIVAIATAYGEGGIGIIRISGENAGEILKKIFVHKYSSTGATFNNEARPNLMSDFENRKLVYGHIFDVRSKNVIDEVLAVFMRAPNTYTREDVVEIHCHGSIVSLGRILKLILFLGARLAEPGEFTKRAFLNGRIDLAQAESVIDLIKAKTDLTYDVALSQLEGKFSLFIEELRKPLLDILVEITVFIEYPDEDIEEPAYESVLIRLKEVKEKLKEAIKSFDSGKVINEGLRTAIIGKPNVGKSSLLNVLLNEPRAIVTDIPGTTRDIIEEVISINGIPVILIDTAGIRNTRNKIEKIGIERSKLAFNEADLVILVLDASEPLTKEDIDIMERLRDKKVIVLKNKSDINNVIADDEIKKLVNKVKIVETSMIQEVGIDKIKKTIEKYVHTGKIKAEKSEIVTNARHVSLLETALETTNDAIKIVKKKKEFELIEIDVSRVYEILGEIKGDAVRPDIINEVFARFCLGK